MPKAAKLPKITPGQFEDITAVARKMAEAEGELVRGRAYIYRAEVAGVYFKLSAEAGHAVLKAPGWSIRIEYWSRYSLWKPDLDSPFTSMKFVTHNVCFDHHILLAKLGIL